MDGMVREEHKRSRTSTISTRRHICKGITHIFPNPGDLSGRSLGDLWGADRRKCG